MPKRKDFVAEQERDFKRHMFSLNQKAAQFVQENNLFAGLPELRRVAHHTHESYGTESFIVVGGGSDDANQLGSVQGDDSANKETEYKPFVLSGLHTSNVKKVAAGGLHSVFLTTDGRVFTMGASDDGVLGRDESVHESVPGEVTGFVHPNGNVEDGTIIRIAAGNSHTLCLAKSGNVYQFGMMRGDDVRSRGVDRGRYRSIDCCGRCQTLTHSHTTLPQQKKFGISNPDGSRTECNKKPTYVAMDKPVAVIAAGTDTSAVITKDGELLTWGFGDTGELGRSRDMTTPDKNGKYDLGKDFCFRKVYNEEGEATSMEPNMSIINEHFLKPKPVHFNWGAPHKTVLDVACGGFHMLVTAREPGSGLSQVYSSGMGGNGQLGHGDQGDDFRCDEFTLIEDLKDKNIAYVAAGEHFSLCMDLKGWNVYGFGRSDSGSLGLGDVKAKSVLSPTPVLFPDHTVVDSIEAGGECALLVTVDQKLFVMGFNENAALMMPSRKEAKIPTFVPIHVGNTVSQVYAASTSGTHSLLLVEPYDEEPASNDENKAP